MTYVISVVWWACRQTVHDAEADLEIAKIDMEKVRDKLSKMRLLLREQQTGEGEAALSVIVITVIMGEAALSVIVITVIRDEWH